MKLLYLTPYICNPAGTERALSMKVNYLIRQCGYDVVIVTTDQHGKANAFEWDERMKHYDLGLNYDDDFGKDILAKWWVYRRKNRIYRKKLQAIIDREQPDVCISLFGKELEWWRRLRIPGKSVAELHFSHAYRKDYLLSNHRGWIWEKIGDFRVWQMVRQTRAFDMLVVLTREAKAFWQDRHPLVEQIYNPMPVVETPVAQTHVQEASPVEGAKASREHTVIAVGRLNDLKNYPSLARVWAMVEPKFPGWTLRVWGEGEDRAKIEDEIRRSGLQRMQLCGHTDNIAEQYRKSAIHVMSSKSEGFSMVLLEALGSGLPIVSYACPTGPKEVITDGENGYLIAPGDEKGMAEALCRLMADEGLREQMGKASLEKAQQFAPGQILPQWPRLFETLTQK